MREPKIATIEGRRTLVVERDAPLPQRLDRLLGELTMVRYRDDIRPKGARAACELRMHRFMRMREGRHVGLDGIVRDLRIEMCADCGAVCVRDVSVDLLPGVRVAARGPNRKSHVIGWYSGARRSGREYK